MSAELSGLAEGCLSRWPGRRQLVGAVPVAAVAAEPLPAAAAVVVVAAAVVELADCIEDYQSKVWE